MLIFTVHCYHKALLNLNTLIKSCVSSNLKHKHTNLVTCLCVFTESLEAQDFEQETSRGCDGSRSSPVVMPSSHH